MVKIRAGRTSVSPWRRQLDDALKFIASARGNCIELENQGVHHSLLRNRNAFEKRYKRLLRKEVGGAISDPVTTQPSDELAANVKWCCQPSNASAALIHMV